LIRKLEINIVDILIKKENRCLRERGWLIFIYKDEKIMIVLLKKIETEKKKIKK
jgi:tRNA1(Val) A37 N6-methylase TrmN6